MADVAQETLRKLDGKRVAGLVSHRLEVGQMQPTLDTGLVLPEFGPNLGRHWPTSAGSWSTLAELGQIRLTSAQHVGVDFSPTLWPNSAALFQHLGRHRPTSAEIGPKRCFEFGQNLRHLPSSARFWPTLGQTMADFGRILVDIGERLPTIGEVHRTVGANGASFDQDRADFGNVRTDVRWIATNFEPSLAEFGHICG